MRFTRTIRAAATALTMASVAQPVVAQPAPGQLKLPTIVDCIRGVIAQSQDDGGKLAVRSCNTDGGWMVLEASRRPDGKFAIVNSTDPNFKLPIGNVDARYGLH